MKSLNSHIVVKSSDSRLVTSHTSLCVLKDVGETCQVCAVVCVCVRVCRWVRSEGEGSLLVHLAVVIVVRLESSFELMRSKTSVKSHPATTIVCMYTSPSALLVLRTCAETNKQKIKATQLIYCSLVRIVGEEFQSSGSMYTSASCVELMVTTGSDGPFKQLWVKTCLGRVIVVCPRVEV